MAGSDITVSGLVAVDDVKGVKFEWVVTDPWPKDMRTSLDAVELWEATANDRAHGSFAKIGEGLTGFSRAGLNRGDIRFYWSRARNKYGSYGPWHPSSATAGVVGTEVSGDVLIATNGYWKHPSGLIEQWGDALTGVGGVVTVTFPIPFPNQAFNISLTRLGNHTPTITYIVSTRNLTNSSFDVHGDYVLDGGEVNTLEDIGFFWRALGY